MARHQHADGSKHSKLSHKYQRWVKGNIELSLKTFGDERLIRDEKQRVLPLQRQLQYSLHRGLAHERPPTELASCF